MSQTHIHPLVDSDPHFVVNGKTRKIEPVQDVNIVLMQGDHNSEVITFEVPRYIEGHDMLQCDLVRVSYINIEGPYMSTQSVTGAYEVTDLRENPGDSDSLIFTWTISNNATMYSGLLSFAIVFTCTDGVNVTYRWYTEPYRNLLVNSTIQTDDIFTGDSLDLIEQWKAKLLSELDGLVEESLGKNVNLGKIDENYSRTTSLVTDVDILTARLDNYATGAESNLPDNAELLDIRVDAEGKTHSNAGEAVRTQVSQLNENDGNLRRLIDHELNHILHNIVIPCEFIPGYINSSLQLGDPGEETKEITSDFIEVSTGDALNIICEFKETPSGSYWMAYTTYDSSGNAIERVNGGNTNMYLTCDGSYSYIRVSMRTYGIASVMVVKKDMKRVCSYIPIDQHKPGYVYVPLKLNGGYISDSGDRVYSFGARCEVVSDMVAVTPGETYRIISTVSHDGSSLTPPNQPEYHWVGVSFFDTSGIYIQRQPYVIMDENEEQTYTVDQQFVIPNNVGYIRVAARTYWTGTLHLVREENISAAPAFENALSAVKGIAHRGLSSVAPENTLPAYQKAKEAGFYYVECDVQFSSDNIAVLWHDDTIDAKSNGTGAIADHTLAELKALDVGSWFSGYYAGTKIPTFEEFIALCRKLSLHPYIELKLGTQEQVEGLVAIVKAYGMLDKVTWIGGSARLVWVTALYSKSRVGIVVGAISSNQIDEMDRLKTGENEVFIDSCVYGETEVALCRDGGIPLEVWTLNTEEAILALPPYVSGVSSDIFNAGMVFYEASR